MDQNKMGLQNVTLSKPYVFFLVRHGQSLHNETNTRGLVIDTPLTDAGRASARDAATFLRSYLSKVGAYFVSDLYRTRETMNAFKGSQEVYVLPCASEVGNVGKNGDCDSSGQIWNKLAQENYSSCNRDIIANSIKCRANWETYLDFYGNQIRGPNMSGARMRCRNTNMLAMAIYILDFKMKMSLDAFMTKNTFVPKSARPQNNPEPPPNGPRPQPENTNTYWFSYGGTKRRKLKRNRTRRR
jgi:hypothetical protein